MAMTPIKGSNPPNVNTVLQSNPGDRVAADKGSIAPIVAVLSRQLPLPQAQQLAGQTVMVRVAKSGPGNEAQLEVEGQMIPVKMPPGKQLTAGDMITVNFALQDKGESGEAGGSKQTKRTQDIRQLLGTADDAPEDGGEPTNKSFVDRLSSSARLLGLIDRLTQPQVGKQSIVSSQIKSMPALMAQANDDMTIDLPDLINPRANPNSNANGAANFMAGTTNAASAKAAMAGNNPLPTGAAATIKPGLAEETLNPSTSKQAAQNPGQTQASQATQATTAADRTASFHIARHVSNAVEKSGLFYESHLQQWANGERTKSQLLQEPQARFGQEQIISEKGMDPAAFQQSVKLVGQQLAALDQSRLAVNLHGLFQNPVELEIQADDSNPEKQEEAHQAEGLRPWLAKLKLDMPTLGELRVQLRLVGNTVDLQISAPPASKTKMDPHWREFQSALEHNGLSLAHGQIRSTEESKGNDS